MPDGDVIGQCVENEQHDPDGDATQRTTNGRFMWRSDNNWTAFESFVEDFAYVAAPAGVQRLTTDEFNQLFDHSAFDTVEWRPSIPYLFVMQAASSGLTPKGDSGDEFVLTLDQPGKEIVWFSDRPQRLTGQRRLEAFIGAWALFGFVEVPPNAAIVLSQGSESADVLIVTMMDPIWDVQGGRLRFDVKVLRPDDLSGKMADDLAFYSDRAGATLPASFGRVSLFIDSTSLPGCLPNCDGRTSSGQT